MNAIALLRFASAVLVGSLAVAQNLLPNPGFEAGNVGFSSDYQFATFNSTEGQFTVSGLPNSFNFAFSNPPPASAGSTQMMVINGSTLPNQRVWFASVPVVAGTTYRLELAGCTAVSGGPAVLQWQVDGQLVGAPLTLPNATQIWQVSAAEWVAPATGTVEVAIRNLNTATFPNDFYLDDLFVGPCNGCWAHYGSGFPGALGIPNLVPSDVPRIATTIDYRMTSVRNVPELGVLALGLTAASAPTPLGGTLLVVPEATFGLVVPAAPAFATSPLAIPNDPGLVGLEVFGQFVHFDASAALGFAFSRGLELTIGS